MLSVCTTDLYDDLLRHQDVIDRNIQDDAECQHVVDAGDFPALKKPLSPVRKAASHYSMGIRMLLRIR